MQCHQLCVTHAQLSAYTATRENPGAQHTDACGPMPPKQSRRHREPFTVNRRFIISGWCTSVPN